MPWRLAGPFHSSYQPEKPHQRTRSLRKGDFPSGSVVKDPPANAGDASLIPGSGIFPGGGNDNPLQYSCL